MPQRLLFTGQSGLGSKQTLEAFRDELTRFDGGDDFTILQIEEFMLEIFADEEDKEPDPSLWVTDILRLPYSRLADLWEVALGQIQEKIEEELQDEDLFIDFHACFYHHETVEYRSIVKESLLRGLNPDHLVILIDDIYDVHQRLRRKGQLFHIASGGSGSPEEAVDELLRLLTWRAHEISISQHLADELGIQSYLLAVKHRHQILHRLAFDREGYLSCYISHPISEVRRLEEAGKEQQARAVMEEIRSFETACTQEFTAFRPTTIDELRIGEKSVGNGRRKPILRRRWDSERYQDASDFLFIPPEDLERADPLWGNDSATGEAIWSLVDLLSDRIQRQIASRDHKLVDQSDILAVYRPCFNGNPSRGVREEIRHHRNLGKEQCFVFIPNGDKQDLWVRRFEEHIKDTRHNPFSFGDGGQASSFVLTEEQREALLEADRTVEGILPVLDDVLDHHDIYLPAERPGALGSDAYAEAQKLKKAFIEDYLDDLESILSDYEGLATETWTEDGLSPEDFVSEIQSHIGGDG